MSPIDERLKLLDIVLPVVMPPVVEGYVPAFAPFVMVNSTPRFTEPHRVADGASELLVQVFEERGIHARSAIGVAQVPFGACVEIEMVAEIQAAPTDTGGGSSKQAPAQVLVSQP